MELLPRPLVPIPQEANTTDPCGMFDAGQIGRVTFVCSCYFRDANPETFKKMAEAMAVRKQPIIATSRGDWITVESSANLRSHE